MRKLIKGLLIACVVVVLGGLLLTVLYTDSVSDELTRFRRESRSDIVYLRTRIRELESELTAGLLGKGESISKPVGGTADGVETEASTDGDPTETNAVTEAVTVPTHQSPETQIPSVGLPDSSASALYLVTEHNGVIGVFDATGELLRTVNVFIMTLPQAEQDALTTGIPVYSIDELKTLLEQYE